MGIKGTGFLRSLLAALIMAVSLAGCGGGGGGTTTTSGGGGGIACGYSSAPSTPTISSLTPGNASIQVSFYDFSNSATSYVITATPTTGTPVTLTIASTSAMIYTPTMTGLTNGMLYAVTVVGVNCAGTSAAQSAPPTATPVTVPGAPTLSSVTPGNQQVTLTINAPVSDGGSAINYYTVTASPGNMQQIAYSTGPLTFTGLTNGTAYTFTVTATNAIGTGPASSPTAPVTPSTLPGAPTGVVGQAGNAQATVSFTPPASNGGAAITSYTVTSSGGQTATGMASPITVTGLTNGTAYTFTVVATNVDGSGTASKASNSVIPQSNPGPYYVDPVAGLDTNAGTSVAPFKTITYALKVAAGFGTANTINLSAGTYGTASGETFPLMMVNNVNITGAGAGSSIISGGNNYTTVNGYTYNTTLVFPRATTSVVTGVTLTGATQVLAIMDQATSANLTNDAVTPGATTGIDGLYIMGTNSATLTGDSINGTCGTWGAVTLWIGASNLVGRGNTLSDTCNPAVYIYSGGIYNSNVDLGTAASPGNNTIHGGTTGPSGSHIPVGINIDGDTNMVYASGDTWYPSTQGSDSAGHYVVGTYGTNPTGMVVAGNNYAINSTSPSAGLAF